MIAPGPNSATGASAAMIVVSVRRQTRTCNFDCLDHVEKPMTPLLREFDFPLRWWARPEAAWNNAKVK